MGDRVGYDLRIDAATRPVGLLAAILAVAAFSACVGDGRGAEGEPCKLGTVNYFCNDGLICNNTLMWTRCVRPMSLHEGDVCGSNDVCQAGLSLPFPTGPHDGRVERRQVSTGVRRRWQRQRCQRREHRRLDSGLHIFRQLAARGGYLPDAEVHIGPVASHAGSNTMVCPWRDAKARTVRRRALATATSPSSMAAIASPAASRIASSPRGMSPPLPALRLGHKTTRNRTPYAKQMQL